MQIAYLPRNERKRKRASLRVVENGVEQARRGDLAAGFNSGQFRGGSHRLAGFRKHEAWCLVRLVPQYSSSLPESSVPSKVMTRNCTYMDQGDALGLFVVLARSALSILKYMTLSCHFGTNNPSSDDTPLILRIACGYMLSMPILRAKLIDSS